jgi:hypothetical protein
MKDLKKMMGKMQPEGGKPDVREQLKLRALKELSDEMSSISGGSLMESMAPKAAVTVATDDPKKLPQALEDAKELTEELPSELLASSEMDEENEEEDDVADAMDDLEELSPEQLKEMIRKLKAKV